MWPSSFNRVRKTQHYSASPAEDLSQIFRINRHNDSPNAGHSKGEHLHECVKVSKNHHRFLEWVCPSVDGETKWNYRQTHLPAQCLCCYYRQADKDAILWRLSLCRATLSTSDTIIYKYGRTYTKIYNTIEQLWPAEDRNLQFSDLTLLFYCAISFFISAGWW